jgi:hypothetical protein
VTGRQLRVAAGAGGAGDIVLQVDRRLKGEGHTLEISQAVEVRGGNYAAVALGTATLLQALSEEVGGLTLPKLSISDEPAYRMRAIQMCIKHQAHDLSKVKQGVDLCRQYKLNTLALHMSNYQLLWMLCPPCRENPLPKGNFDGGQTHSREEMLDLVDYARQRGVTIMPEWGPADFAMPGEMMQWFYKARQFGDFKRFDRTKETLLDNPAFWEAMAERSWNPEAGKMWENFSRRWLETSRRLEFIHFPMNVTATGLTADSRFYSLDHRWRSGTECYAREAVITLQPRLPDLKVYYKVYYTLQDPYFIWNPERPGPVNAKAKLYTEPVRLTNGAVVFRARCFDAAGRPVGGEFVKWYQHQPVLIEVEGVEEKFDALGRALPLAFHRKATIKLSTFKAWERIRYRTSPPGGRSPTPDLEYAGPITIEDTTTFWIGLGKEGYCLNTTISSDGYKENLLTVDGVKVTATGQRQIGDPRLVVDRYADNPDAHWNGIGESTFTIELPAPQKINEVQVFCWWGDGRVYRYTVEASPDGRQWQPLADMSQNNKPSSPEGYTHKFAAREIKLLRIHPQGNSVNNHGHLSEVRAFERK